MLLFVYIRQTANSVPGEEGGSTGMLPFMFNVKKPQHLPDNLPCAFRVSVRFEAVAELPRSVVKRRVIPLKSFDASITQDDEISLVGIRLPAFSSIRWLWIVA